MFNPVPEGAPPEGPDYSGRYLLSSRFARPLVT